MRTFFALDLSPRLKLDIERWRELSLPDSNARIPTANFHVTLCFNGKTSQQQLCELESAVQELTQELSQEHKMAPFSLHFNEFGYFTKPGIAFIGCNNVPDPLMELNQQLERISRQQGLSIERRPYVPHISLFRRLTTPPPSPVMEPNFTLEATSFTLFESVTQKEGVRYQSIFEWPLQAPMGSIRQMLSGGKR